MSDINQSAARLIATFLYSPPHAVVEVKNYARAAFKDPDPIGRLVALAPIGHALIMLVEATIADIADATRSMPGRWELAVPRPF